MLEGVSLSAGTLDDQVSLVVRAGMVFRYDALAISELGKGTVRSEGGASLVSNSAAICFMRRAASSDIALLALSTFRIAARPR